MNTRSETKKTLKRSTAIGLSALMVVTSLSLFPIGEIDVKAASEHSETYTGSEIKPAVTVLDDCNNKIPADEYSVEYSNNINAGTATVTVSDAKNSNSTGYGNYAITTKSETFIIHPKKVTPTIEIDTNSFTYNGSSKTPTITVKDGDKVIGSSEYTVSYSNKYGDEDPVANNTTDCGTVTITVTDAKTGGDDATGANGNYTINNASKTYKINPATNTLTFSKESDSVNFPNSASFDVTGNISGGYLSVSSSNENVARATVAENVSTGTVSIETRSAGTAKITVTSASTRNYQTFSKSFTLTVNKGTMTVNKTDGTGTYIDAGDGINQEQELGSVTVDAPETSTIKYSTAYTSPIADPAYETICTLPDKPKVTNVGTYYVYYRVTAGNYNDATGYYTVTINKSASAWAKAETGLVYNTNEQTGATSFGSTLSGERQTNAGDYNATATLDANHTWNEDTKTRLNVESEGVATVPYSIAKADNGLIFKISDETVTSGTITYKGSITFDLERVSPDGAYEVTTSNGSIATATRNGNEVTVTGTGVGEAVITIKSTGSANYKDIEKTYSIIVNPADLTDYVSSSDGSAEYNGSEQVLGSVTCTNPEGGATFSYSRAFRAGEEVETDRSSESTKPSVTDCGVYTVFYTVSAPNYNDKTGSYKVTITKKENTLAISDITGKVYNSEDFTATLSNGGNETGIEGGVITWSISSGSENADINAESGLIHIKNVGSVTVKASKTETKNYRAVEATKTFVITSASISGSNIEVTASCTPGSYNGREQSPVITVTDNTIEGFGVLDGRAATLIEGTDYDVTYPDNMTDAGTKTYSITGKGRYTGTKGSLTYTIDPLDIENATLSAEDSSTVYDSTMKSPSLSTISTTTADDNPITINFSDLTLGADYTTKYAERISESEEGERHDGAPVNVGTYNFYVIGTGNGNISGTTGALQFTISQRDIGSGTATVEFPSAEYVYNGLTQEITPTVKRVLNNGGSEQTLTTNDYDIEYAGDRVNASDEGITVTVKGKGNFTGQATGTYKIIPYTVQSTDDPNVTITETDTAIINNGETINFADHIAITSKLGVTGDATHPLVIGRDYTLERENLPGSPDPDRDGKIRMILKFSGNYKDQNVAGHTYTANVSYQSQTGAVFSYNSETHTLTVSGGTENIDADIKNRIAATGSTSVVIGTGAGAITAEAFRGTDKEHITAITALNGSGYSAVDGMLLSGDGTTLIAAPFGLTATNITIPNGVTSISKGAFSGMTGITDIAFPASLRAIGEGAFDGCSELASADLTGTAITDIGKDSFKETKLTTVTIPSGATAHEGAFSDITLLTNVTIEGAAEPGAFSGISSLDNLSITDTASIETGALDNGTTITALTIDGNPTIYSDEPGKINEETFFGAVMPTAVSITNNNELETMPSGSTSDAFLIRKDGEEKVLVKALKPITAAEIPEGVTAISKNAFKDKTEITSATFPSTLKAIGSNSFKGTGLTSVTVPSEVIVKTGAFSNITTLNSVTINGAKVETDAFSNSADSISTLTINAGSDIETGAFKENLSVGHLTINGVSTVYSGTENEISSEFFSKHSFSDISISDNNDFETMANGAEADSFLVAISGGEKTIIKALKPATDITIPDGVTGIGGGVFKDNATLRSVTIPASVTSIGAGAFEGSGLTSVTLSEGLLNIGGNAFKGTAIMAINLPSTLKTIGDSAFEGTGLTAISIPEGVTTIGNSAFKGTGLTTVVIPSTITTIGTDVFSGTSITDITVPESVPADETTFGDSWTRLTVIGEHEKTVTTRSTIDNGNGTTTTTISSETTNVSTGAFIRSREVATTRKDADSSVVQTRTTTGERTEDGGKKLVTVTETTLPTGKETSTKTVIKDSLGVTTSAKETIVTEENAMNGSNTVKTVTTVEKEGDNEGSMTEEKTTVVRTEKDPSGEEVDKTTTVTVRTPSGTKETMERHYYKTDANGNKVTVDVKTITERDEDENETSYTEIRKTDVTADGVRTETTTELIYTTEGGVRTLTGKTEVIKTTTPNEHGSTVKIITNIYDPEHPDTIASTSEEVTNYDHEGHVIKTKVAEVNVDDSAASKFGHLIVQDVSGGDGWDETYSLTATTVTEEMTEESTEKIKESTKTSAYAVLDIGFTQGGAPVEMPTSQYTLTFKYPADWPSPATVNPEFYWYDDTTNTMQKLNAEFVTIGGETYVQATLNHFSYYVITYAKKASGGSGGSGGTGGGSTGGGSTGGGGGGFIITTHTVTYTDGVDGEEVFKDQTFKKNHGSDTPVFSGTPEREGYTFTGWDPIVEKKVTRDITYTAQWVKKGEEKPIDWHEEEPGEEEKPDPVITTLIKIFRLFNPLGFHLFTTNANERDYLMSLGWNDEGTGFSAAEDATIPVYRLYNPYNGDHLFTADTGERDHVVPLGWIYEGVAFKAQETGTPIYRLFNTTTGEHFYTRNELERNFLAGLGWRPEGVAFYMSE